MATSAQSAPTPAITPRPPRSDDPIVADLLARCTLTHTPHRVTVAVSGGPDSTALLALAIAAGHRVTAVHVDHGLRPGSHAEGATVAALARRWGASARLVQAHVEDGPNLEERCRVARHDALPAGTLHGHTADDLAETVLMRILRGTGPDGLAPMDPATHPLLGLRRADTEALCAHLGVEPLRDPTNSDPRFTRNRVRHELLPLMAEVAGRDVVPLLARLAELAGENRALLDDLSAGVDPTDTVALRRLPRPLAAAVLRRWWIHTTSLPTPDAAAVDRMWAVASGDIPRTDVARGWSLHRTGGRLRLQAAPGAGDRSVGDQG